MSYSLSVPRVYIDKSNHRTSILTQGAGVRRVNKHSEAAFGGWCPGDGALCASTCRPACVETYLAKSLQLTLTACCLAHVVLKHLGLLPPAQRLPPGG